MEKHIHHLPHFIDSFMHTIPFLAAMFKDTKAKEEVTCLGDNFPTWLCFKEKRKYR